MEQTPKKNIPTSSTPIIHELVEKLAHTRLSGYENNIIWAVIRMTYGWHKKEDWISGSQLSKLTRILPNHCLSTVHKLVLKNILIKNGLKIGLNKNTKTWLVPESVVLESVVPESVRSSTQIRTQPVLRSVHTKEIITKEINTKEIIVDNKKFKEDSQEYILAKLLSDLIRKNNEKAKTPNLQNWAADIDKMLRIDGHSFTEIQTIIYWSQQDTFWLQNILSASKLREKFSSLWIKAKTQVYNQARKQQDTANIS